MVARRVCKHRAPAVCDIHGEKDAHVECVAAQDVAHGQIECTEAHRGEGGRYLRKRRRETQEQRTDEGLREAAFDGNRFGRQHQERRRDEKAHRRERKSHETLPQQRSARLPEFELIRRCGRAHVAVHGTHAKQIDRHHEQRFDADVADVPPAARRYRSTSHRCEHDRDRAHEHVVR